ncbi:MAG: TMEM165/GDT1 family protein [Dorea sp.]|nr:TMEM165/GDT1 family protein [Dorea sp.]
MFLFLKIMFTEFIAEMGDKTQLMLVGMTSKYKLKDIILGTAVAILILNGIAVLAGGLVSAMIPTWLIKLVAAAAFLYFAITTIGGEEEEEEEAGEHKKFQLAPVAVAATFFVAELGDKTQLTAITFGANEGLSKAVVVWLACSIGLFAADIIGMLIGILIKDKTSDGFLDILAYAIFSVFGIFTFRQGLLLLMLAKAELILKIVIVVAVVYFAASVCIFRWHRAKALKNRHKE